jgi:hypothetical protein
MTSASRHHRRSLSAQAALVLLGCCSVFAADARAGCGEYVQIFSGSGGYHAPADPLPGHDGGPAAPCHGPGCSRHDPPLDPPAAPAPAGGPHSQLDALLPLSDPPDPSLSAGLGPDPRPVPAAAPADVFRPPRAS